MDISVLDKNKFSDKFQSPDRSVLETTDRLKKSCT